MKQMSTPVSSSLFVFYIKVEFEGSKLYSCVSINQCKCYFLNNFCASE